MSIELWRIEGLLNGAINDNISGVDIVFENTGVNGQAYTPTTGEPFIETFFIPTEPQTIEVGTCGRDRYQGIYQVNFNYPQYNGKYDMNQKIIALMDTVRRGATFTDGTVTVRIRSVYQSLGYQGQDDTAGFFITPLTIVWDCDLDMTA